MRGVDIRVYVRPLRILEFVVQDALNSNATPGAALAEEGGRGVSLRRFLLPTPLLPPDLVPLGGGLGLAGTGGLFHLGHRLSESPHQTSPDRAPHVLLDSKLRHSGRKHHHVADAAVPRHPAQRPHLSERSRPPGFWCVMGVYGEVLCISCWPSSGAVRCGAKTWPGPQRRTGAHVATMSAGAGASVAKQLPRAAR